MRTPTSNFSHEVLPLTCVFSHESEPPLWVLGSGANDNSMISSWYGWQHQRPYCQTIWWQLVDDISAIKLVLAIGRWQLPGATWSGRFRQTAWSHFLISITPWVVMWDIMGSSVIWGWFPTFKVILWLSAWLQQVVQYISKAWQSSRQRSLVSKLACVS